MHFAMVDADGTVVDPELYVDPNNPYPTSSSNTSGTNSTQIGTSSNILQTDTSKGVLMLINEWNRLPDGWVPSNLVTKNGYQMQSEVADAYQKMSDAYKSETGTAISLCSAYRTEQWQKDTKSQHPNDSLYANYYATEHRTGLALDFVAATQWGKWINAYPTLWNWLCVHAKDYGFILRYPLGSYAKTGVYAESWHWRYIGVERAQDFYAAAEGKRKGTTPNARNTLQASGDQKTTNTSVYYLYTYEEYYEEYIIPNKWYSK